MQDLDEKTIQTDMIYNGKLIKMTVEHVLLPDGRTVEREVVRHPGAAAILALHEDRMIVVEQYRTALGRTQVEIPAGKLEAGEDPLTAAKRELEEETGYQCAELQHLCSFYTSPGFADEIVHLYVAVGLTNGQAKLDQDEFLTCSGITLQEALQFIAERRISDAKTIAAVYAWQLYRLTGRFSHE